MTAVTKTQAQTISREIEAAAAEILARHGLSAPKIRTSYGDYFKLSIESSPVTIGDSGVNETSKEAVAFKRFHKSYNLPENALGARFTVNGKEYVFTGLAVSRSKYPIATTRVSDGETVFFTDTAVPKIVAAASAVAR